MSCSCNFMFGLRQALDYYSQKYCKNENKYTNIFVTAKFRCFKMNVVYLSFCGRFGFFYLMADLRAESQCSIIIINNKQLNMVARSQIGWKWLERKAQNSLLQLGFYSLAFVWTNSLLPLASPFFNKLIRILRENGYISMDVKVRYIFSTKFYYKKNYIYSGQTALCKTYQLLFGELVYLLFLLVRILYVRFVHIGSITDHGIFRNIVLLHFLYHIHQNCFKSFASFHLNLHFSTTPSELLPDSRN